MYGISEVENVSMEKSGECPCCSAWDPSSHGQEIDNLSGNAL